MKKIWADFKKFISRGNVVDMAVGVAVASAFTAIVTAFNKGVIGPIIALFTGNSDFSTMKWVLREEVLAADGVTVEVAEVAIMYGTLIQTVLDFLMIAVTLFIVLRIASQISAKARQFTNNVKEMLTPENEAEIAKQKATEEEAAKIAAEEEAARVAAEEAATAEALKAKEEAEKQKLLSCAELLEEIRDLLKEKK
jgi:large conductance mechanosensitive channel